MRKFILLFSAFTMAIGLTACSSNDDAKTEKKDTPKETANETAAPKIDVKKELVKFYMELGNKINAKDSDLIVMKRRH